jgi:hypothetical protein
MWLMELSIWGQNPGSLVVIPLWVDFPQPYWELGRSGRGRWCKTRRRLRREHRSHVQGVEPNSTKGVVQTARWSLPRTAC